MNKALLIMIILGLIKCSISFIFYKTENFNNILEE